MAYSLASSETGTSTPPDDLIVTLYPNNLDFAEFRGTRDSLVAEGLIPPGTDWPQAYENLRWQAGQFKYWLRRERPPGAKGPRRAFASVDWFCLHQQVAHGPSDAQRAIDRKAREIMDMVRLNSDQGQAEWSAKWNRYLESTKDAAFQAFKATIPGLVRRKRGRPRKVSAEAQST